MSDAPEGNECGVDAAIVRLAAAGLNERSVGEEAAHGSQRVLFVVALLASFGQQQGLPCDRGDDVDARELELKDGEDAPEVCALGQEPVRAIGHGEGALDDDDVGRWQANEHALKRHGIDTKLGVRVNRQRLHELQAEDALDAAHERERSGGAGVDAYAEHGVLDSKVTICLGALRLRVCRLATQSSSAERSQ